MWYAFLQSNYRNFADFRSHDDLYGLAERLGYKSARAAWRANPYVQGSTNPGDFMRVDYDGLNAMITMRMGDSGPFVPEDTAYQNALESMALALHTAGVPVKTIASAVETALDAYENND